MAEYYLPLKWLHILGATVLFGTGLGTAFHFWYTLRTGGIAAIAASARATVLADWCRTSAAHSPSGRRPAAITVSARPVDRPDKREPQKLTITHRQ